MNVISQIFKDKKSLPLNTFIDKALYNKKYGYYSKKNPIGTKGDFITAPLISELFGEMVAVWCIAFWEKLRKPKNINIVELGPGEGSLCMTLIKVFSRFKIFNDAFEIKLLEKSKFLRKIQEKKITSKKVKWIKSIEEIKNGPTIFIANEFFDALPIKQFVLKKEIWHERFVKCINDEKLIFYDKKANLNNIKHFARLSLAKKQKFIEFPIEAIKYLTSISKIIKKHDGGMICFDYGYKKIKMSDSLQSVKKHGYSKILLNVGNSDITHHINFNLFSKIIRNLGLHLEGITEQGIFLQKMGIIHRANILTKNVNFNVKADVYYRLKRLMSRSEMGKIFKVIFFNKKGVKFNLGFK